jgi:hypothetical protein
MKATKRRKNEETKKKGLVLDFRNTKSTTWNSKRRFGL